MHPLKAYREREGISQRELAHRLGVSAMTVIRWETNKRKIRDDMVCRVSGLTGIAAAELRPDLARLLGAAR